jgi:hypothetical protein
MPEKVLIVCTASPPKAQRALQVLQDHLFRKPEVDFLCTLKDLPAIEGEKSFREVIVFPPRNHYRSAFQLWKRLVGRHYDVIVVLWCLEGGRLRHKLFALLCGSRRILVFNENLDCDYLSPAFLKRLIKARAANGTLMRSRRWSEMFLPLKDGYWGILRLVSSPLRVLVLAVAVLSLYLPATLRRKRTGRDRKRVIPES